MTEAPGPPQDIPPVDEALPGAQHKAGVRATEANAQCITTVGLLARDHLSPHGFELLYQPFARFIRAGHMARE